MTIDYTGSLFIVAAPSGGGKTSLVRYLVQNLENIAISISHTTREKRPGEVDGVDYFFIDKNTFLNMVTNAEFIEHAQVFNNYYGTAEAQIKNRLQSGVDVLLAIDWQGAQQVRKIFKNVVNIFLIPPSLDVLKQRLSARQQDSSETITVRMERAKEELSHYPEFDYLIVNDDFDKAAEQIKSIVIANRLRIARQCLEQKELLSFLLGTG